MYMLCFNHSVIATINPLSNSVVREGNTVTITCEALGYPPPTVVWSRANGTLSDRVSVSDSVSVPIGYGSVTRVGVNLTITNASREDTGVYMCSANNSVGSDNKYISTNVQCKLRTHTYTHKLIMQTFICTYVHTRFDCICLLLIHIYVCNYSTA